MAYQQKDNSGSLFKNDKKREGKKDADYTGSAVVGGRDFWVDSWINNNPRDPDYDPQKKTYLSLKFRPKDRPAGERPAKQAAQPPQRRQAPRPPSHESPTDMHNDDQTF